MTEIALQFRDVPHRLFRSGPLAPNTLALRIQPDEGITLRFDAKVPGRPVADPAGGHGLPLRDVVRRQPPEAYERLMLDAMLGDSTLFIRRDEVEASWRLHRPAAGGLGRRGRRRPRCPSTLAGTWGPAEADVMLARDGRTWRRP